MVENRDEVKILWDFNVESDHVVVHGRPHIVFLEKKRSMLYPLTLAFQMM